jgi:hypothetical protein
MMTPDSIQILDKATFRVAFRQDQSADLIYVLFVVTDVDGISLLQTKENGEWFGQMQLSLNDFTYPFQQGLFKIYEAMSKLP